MADDPTGPKYQAIARILEEQVTRAAPHDPLPTERELQERFSVSRETVRRALKTLIERGLVYNVQGSGTFVADPAWVTKSLHLTGFSEDMAQRGKSAASRVLEYSLGTADDQTATVLGIQPGAPTVTLKRLRLADGLPMALEHVEVADPNKMLTTIDPESSLYAQLSVLGIEVVRARQSITAINLDANQARLLDQAVGAAALRVERVSYDRSGQAIESAETIYRGDRYNFDLVVRRRAER